MALRRDPVAPVPGHRPRATLMNGEKSSGGAPDAVTGCRRRRRFPESLAAAEWAAREAVRRDRPLRLLHVRNWSPRRAEAETAHAAERRRGRDVLRQAEERARRACPGVLVYDEQVEGPASAALVKAAADAEPLVLGSRGSGRMTGLLVGSVALEVVARASGPVVLVRADGTAAEARETDGGGRRDVVLGADVTQPCDEVIEFAFEAARRAARG
ncbi:hypothetical protein SHKM778_42560 [Streptomyces sp. KM77-8]|uniref:UspA domain-containing protein n=1 Tax=Streptomyces haneummycinicus TaxID=3074435 RepID=A0AAT9HKR8_9ACTN